MRDGRHLGNLYDRLGLWWQSDYPVEWRSGVRDWILLCYKGLTWPNFNIADSLLVRRHYAGRAFVKPVPTGSPDALERAGQKHIVSNT